MARTSVLLPFVPLLAAFVAFASGLGGGFVLDDRLAIVDNPVVTGDVGVLEAFRRTFWGAPLGVGSPSYRPLATLTYRLDEAVFGLSPLGFHLTSLVYYLLLVHLAHRLARRWLDEPAAVLAATLFATCPLHVENVTGLVGRADVLALIGSLVALLLVTAPGGNARRDLPLACVAYLGAVLCKESAFVLPAVVLCVEIVGGRDARPWTARHRASLWLGVVGAIYLVGRVASIPDPFGYAIADDLTTRASALQRIDLAGTLAFEYARLMVAPVDLCVGRKYAEVGLAPGGLGWRGVAGAGLAAVVVWITVRDVRGRRVPLLACAAVSYLVFSSVLVPPPELMADRFMLAPTLFVALWVVRVVDGLPFPPKARAGVVLACVAAQIAVSAVYATKWRSNDALLRHATVEACPDSVHNHFRYAHLLADDGRTDEAVWHFALAAEGRRHFPGPWRHPARDAEVELPAAARVEQMHALLGVPAQEAVWRAQLVGFLGSLGRVAEAQRVAESSPVPLAGR